MYAKKPFDRDDNQDGDGGGTPPAPKTKTATRSTTDPECGLFHKGEHEQQIAYVAEVTASRYFVRLAKKFSDDYDAVYGEGKAMENDDLQNAIPLICDANEVPEATYEYDYIYHSSEGYTVKDSSEWRFIAYWEDDKYILDYYFNYSWYEQWYCGVKHSGGEYIDILKSLYRQKGAFRYFCNQRPPSPGGIPPGFVTYEAYRNRQKDGVWCPGEVTYNEQLTQAQMQEYGLEFDAEWERARNAYIYGIY